MISETYPGAVPTVTLNYPSNIPGGPGHNWANGVAMATPIANKGVIAGAKVQAMTMLDILLKPDLVQKAWDYYNNVQAKETKYKSLLRPDDNPAIWLNQKTMEEYRPPPPIFSVCLNACLCDNFAKERMSSDQDPGLYNDDLAPIPQAKRRAVGTILLGNLIVLVPMLPNAHAGTKYGIPFPVYARASFTHACGERRSTRQQLCF